MIDEDGIQLSNLAGSPEAGSFELPDGTKINWITNEAGFRVYTDENGIIIWDVGQHPEEMLIASVAAEHVINGLEGFVYE